MSDPTYNAEAINVNPAWRVAFALSEILNDRAPIGWSRYVSAAECLLSKFNVTPKNPDAIAPAARLTRNPDVPEEVARLVGMLSAVASDFDVEHVFLASLEFAVWNMTTRAQIRMIGGKGLAPWVEKVLHMMRLAFFSNWERQRQATDIEVKPN